MLTVAVVIACGLVACPGAAYADDAATDKAMRVFTAQKCHVCHSIGDYGKKKGPLDDVGSRLSAAEIRQWLVDPVAMAAKREPKSTRKPPMKKKPIADDDLDSLVGMLSALKK
jgi:mono/diheme cytochrome c family protein